MNSILARLSALLVAAACAMNVAAQGGAPERIIVPYPAGGPSDATARVFADALGDAGSPFIVENIGGATGLVAITKFLADPKGQVFQGSQNEVILPVLVNPAARFRSEDFAPVQYVTRTHLVLATRKGLGVKTLEEFLALARTRQANPLTYGSVGVGSLYHIIGEYLAHAKQLKFNHIPYRGSAPVLQDLLGGQIDFSIIPYQTGLDEMRSKGMLEFVAVFSKEVPATLNGLESVTQTSGLESFEFASLTGYYLKSNAPDDDKARYNALFSKAVETSRVRNALSADGRTVMPAMSTQGAAEIFLAEIAKYRRMVEELKDIKFQ